MGKVANVVNSWPLPIAAVLSGALIATTAIEKVDLPEWLTDAFNALLEQPSQPEPTPEPDAKDRSIQVPYAPVPGRDDRTPIPYVDIVFDLDDADLTSKLNGVGPVFWDHSGQGTGTLIASDIVLTTGHLFAKGGQWKGPFGRTRKPPAPGDGRIYLAACGQSYDFKSIDMGSMAPRARLGLDYAIGVLTQPACPEAWVLPIAATPDDLEGAKDQILLSMGAYRFADIPRYAGHPLYASRPTSDRNARYDVFGVKCVSTGRDDTGDVPEGSTAVIITAGCDGVPGGSGGPLLVSRDGGESYTIIGVTNSYRPKTEYNNYTRIEGAFAKHLAQYIDLMDLPDAEPSSVPSTSPKAMPGTWLPTAEHDQSQEDDQ